jgi:phosphoribosyl-ATP pyrophosphohydrolase/phosphoribosyl-AMP cyclohydrolase/histidinol dehydrogenase
MLLRTVRPGDVQALLRDPVDPQTLATAATIVDAIRAHGETALRAHAERFGEVQPGGPLLLDRAALEAGWNALPAPDRALLSRTAARIRRFAELQRASVGNAEMAIPGGRAGQDVDPVDRAGCYAPGGRYPLPSSVLMTGITARAAGVRHVLVASPRPAPITIGAAYAAGADALLVCGGAHAIAAMAFGIPGLLERCDVVVGPGNRWVTAAKKLVSGLVAIDMLAGPSELIILADESADPAVVAADLLAQAEHDPDALPVLVTTHEPLIAATNSELARQLETLPTHETARAALGNGYAVLAPDLATARDVVDRLAPEHLELLLADPAASAAHLRHYGGLFIGTGTAEVLGDYGAGPNHTLPTGGTARFTGGLSVFHFLRIRTWMQIDDTPAAQELVHDAIALARHEGLEAHARSAEKRLL